VRKITQPICDVPLINYFKLISGKPGLILIGGLTNFHQLKQKKLAQSLSSRDRNFDSDKKVVFNPQGPCWLGDKKGGENFRGKP